MNQQNFLSILRFILTAVGSYLVGKNLLGTQVDDVVWQGWAGGVVALASTIWGIVDKSATVEAVQSGLRSFIVVIGSIAVAAGVIKDSVVEALIGIVTVVVPMVYSQIAKSKNKTVAAGVLPVTKLDGVNPTEQTVNPKP